MVHDIFSGVYDSVCDCPVAELLNSAIGNTMRLGRAADPEAWSQYPSSVSKTMAMHINEWFRYMFHNKPDDQHVRITLII